MAKTKKWVNKFREVGFLGDGGNADVYIVEDENHQQYALKELRNRTEEKRIRFINEIQVAEENFEDIPGIIPIVESDKSEFWYTMPIATPIMKKIEGLDIYEIISGVIQLAETLEKLHSKHIYHRDIKPSNIYFYNNRYCFGDFGLVDFPDNPDLTQSDKGLGAIFTIAPEMKRNPKQADASKADVYSLAKTMWMFLSKDELGFDGVYNYLDRSHSLRFLHNYKQVHTAEIDQLLKVSTENAPDLRPSISEFKNQLYKWAAIYQDRDESQNSDWRFLQKQLFGENAPSSAIWKDRTAIINVLNTVGATPAYNHMLFSDRGGLDFSQAKAATEENCIYLYDSIGFCFLVNPDRLIYESFEDDFRWSYFLLELKKTKPIISRYDRVSYEYLVEDKPGHYVDGKYADYGVYDYDSGEKLPDGYKVLRRYYEGKLLIVLKGGPYNGINGTYDGRHGMCSCDAFREYIEKIKGIYSKMKDDARASGKYNEYSEEKLDDLILYQRVFDINPFETRQSNRIKQNEKQKEEERRVYQEREAFIESNCSSWDYSSALKRDTDIPLCDRKIQYYFELSREHSFVERLINFRNELLTTSGTFSHRNEKDEDVYYVFSIADAKKILSEINSIFLQNIIQEGYPVEDLFHEYFTIEISRCGKPEHLFTEEEIEIEMRNADDRIDNVLIIDANGYAHVIASDESRFLYPVRHETWQAGNNYVGKYSPLSTLKDNFLGSLQGWLDYLTYGKHCYIDYIGDERNIEELLEKISTFYD